MKNTTKTAGITGLVLGALGIGAVIAGALAKSKDDTVDAANNEFDQKMDEFCENNNNEETNTTDVPAAEEQEAEAPAEEG